MEYLFIHYPTCSTCRNARKWLEANNIPFRDRHIVEENPTQEELERWIGRSKLPIKKFFNTSGLSYKALQLKDKLSSMTDAEQIALLATDGKLIKRPLLIGEKEVLVGFKEEEWKKGIE